MTLERGKWYLALLFLILKIMEKFTEKFALTRVKDGGIECVAPVEVEVNDCEDEFIVNGVSEECLLKCMRAMEAGGYGIDDRAFPSARFIPNKVTLEFLGPDGRRLWIDEDVDVFGGPGGSVASILVDVIKQAHLAFGGFGDETNDFAKDFRVRVSSPDW